jgi:hypothetical protein
MKTKRKDLSLRYGGRKYLIFGIIKEYYNKIIYNERKNGIYFI